MSADRMLEWVRSQGAPLRMLPLPVVADTPETISVLLVDDERCVRSLLRWALEDDPAFRVVGEAPDGREAVGLARHHQPDLVLLDLAMPGVGGLEALPLIRAVAPSAQVVVISGLDDDEVADRARSHGAVGFLAKGAGLEHLADDLHKLLGAALAS
jgi:DNA-binding NarL/FixJ family response regulator